MADPDAAARLAALLGERHGGVDIVFGNAVMRVGPDDDPRAIIEPYTEVNNFGTTRLLRAFAPLLRDGGRLIVVASSLGTLNHLAPALHSGSTDCPHWTRWTSRWPPGATRSPTAAPAPAPGRGSSTSRPRSPRSRPCGRWPTQRREQDSARGILLAAVCPGMINTPTSALWWDVSTAPSPAQAAVAVLDLAFAPVNAGHYGELVRFGQVVPWHQGRIASVQASSGAPTTTVPQ